MTEDDHHLWKKVTDTVKPIAPDDRERLFSPLKIHRAKGSRITAPKMLPLPVSPSALDLHGLTVSDAFIATMAFIGVTNRPSVTIITGKSGQIRREFERWVEQSPRVHSCTEKNGGGAFQVRILKRTR